MSGTSSTMKHKNAPKEKHPSIDSSFVCHFISQDFACIDSNSQDSSATNRVIIACDVGLKRIGLATVINGIILPLEPILRKNRNQAANDLFALLRQRGASMLVVGFPKSVPQDFATLSDLAQSNASIDVEAMPKRIKHFIGLLNCASIDCEVVFVDENFSSLEAMQNLSHTTKSARKKASKDGRLDSLAACEILRRYLSKLES